MNPNYTEYLNQIETAVTALHQGVVNLQTGRGEVTRLCDDKPESSAPTGVREGTSQVKLKVHLEVYKLWIESDTIRDLEFMLINLTSEGRRS
jgi:hypothetical protein